MRRPRALDRTRIACSSAYEIERQQPDARKQRGHDVEVAVIRVAPSPNQPAFEANSTIGSANAGRDAPQPSAQNPNRTRKLVNATASGVFAQALSKLRAQAQVLFRKVAVFDAPAVRRFGSLLAQRNARFDVGLPRERVGDLLRSLDDRIAAIPPCARPRCRTSATSCPAERDAKRPARRRARCSRPR